MMVMAAIVPVGCGLGEFWYHAGLRGGKSGVATSS